MNCDFKSSYEIQRNIDEMRWDRWNWDENESKIRTIKSEEFRIANPLAEIFLNIFLTD